MSVELNAIPEVVKASISNFEELGTIDAVAKVLTEAVEKVTDDYEKLGSEVSHKESLAYVGELAQVVGSRRAFQVWMAAQEEEKK